MLVIHFIGLTMGLGTSFAHAFLGIVVSKMSNEEATKFRMHSLVLSRMGHVGISLLIISGLYLMTPYWSILSSSPLLMFKLILVALLVTLITLIGFSTKRARSGDAEAELKKMERFGKMTLIIGLTTVVVAVLIFH